MHRKSSSVAPSRDKTIAHVPSCIDLEDDRNVDAVATCLNPEPWTLNNKS